MDPAVITSSIAAIAAIVAPLLAERTRSKTTLKVKRLEIDLTNIQKLISEFAEAFGDLTLKPDLHKAARFQGAAYHLLSFVQEPATINAIKSVADDVRDHQAKSTNTEFFFSEAMRLTALEVNELYKPLRKS